MQEKTRGLDRTVGRRFKGILELSEFVPVLPKAILFHCQQSVEKILKAVLEEYDLRVPKIHNIEELYRLMPDAIKETLNISPEHCFPFLTFT